jgi:hypothetical protein
MRLPREPARIIRWLAVPVGRASAWYGAIAVALALRGTRLPGYGSIALHVSVILCCACVAGVFISGCVRWLLRSKPWLPPITTQQARAQRVLRWLVWSWLFIVVVRPSMYVMFWITRPALEQIAAQMSAEPFPSPAPTPCRWIGCYWVVCCRKCPHGMAVYVASGPDDPWRKPGFIYKPEPGECTKFQSGRPLWKHWHTEGW